MNIFKNDIIIIPQQKYRNSRIKIKVICKKHPSYEWLITPSELLKRNGCPVCNKKQKINIDEIRFRNNVIHKECGYIIPNQKYINNHSKIIVICPVHGEWLANPNNFFNGNGCPKCSESKGEKEIRNFLNEKDIIFTTQKKFKGCKDKKLLVFDFYLPDYNICIEYDGEQHFKRFRFEKDDKELIKRQNRDKIKNTYCKNNKIKLYRISYKDNINDKMYKVKKKTILKL